MNLGYLLFNLIVVLYPLIKITEKHIKYYKKLKFLLSGYLLVSIPHIIWDVFATANGDWSFNQSYIIGFKIFNLPIEELMFFFTVPFSCMFVYESVVFLFKDKKTNINYIIFLLIGLISSLLAILNFNLAYTRATFIAFAILNFGIYIIKPKIFEYKNTYITILIYKILFLLANTYLTAIPIVLYSSNAILNIRIGTIPVEDVFFNFSFLVWFLIVYTHFKNKKENV